MRKFQDAYQDAVKELPKYHVDVESVMAQNNYIGFVSRKNSGQKGHRRYFKIAATAASLFLLCGVGTATAMNYQKSKITVGDTGYSVTSPGVTVVSEEMMVVDISDAERAAASEGDDEAVEILEAETTIPVNYDSVEAFRASEAIAVAIPDSEMLGMEVAVENILVMGDLPSVLVRLQNGEQIFCLRQQDNRVYKQYASSTTYMGESVNERNITNSQGLAYVVFDTMEEGEITSTHAIISVNGRDLSMDFYGFEQEVVENVLTQLDLSIYFQD